MDYIAFYQPSASMSKPLYLPGTVTSLNTSRASPFSVCQTALEPNQWNGIFNDVSDRADSIGTRNSDDDEDFPEIGDLLSDMIGNNDFVYADLDSGDSDGFVDKDKLLLGMKQMERQEQREQQQVFAYLHTLQIPCVKGSKKEYAYQI